MNRDLVEKTFNYIFANPKHWVQSTSYGQEFPGTQVHGCGDFAYIALVVSGAKPTANGRFLDKSRQEARELLGLSPEGFAFISQRQLTLGDLRAFFNPPTAIPALVS